MAKWEVSNRELIVFFASVAVALLIMAGGAMKLFDPLVAGIAVVSMVAFFAMAQWLESKGVFSSGMSLVWITFGLGVVMILAGLIAHGAIPLVLYVRSSSIALAAVNALLYSVVILAIVAVILTVYVFYVRGGIPLGAHRKKIE